MNKTISINLGGFSFNIEEEAYNTLKNYLDKIENNFRGDESAKEIMADIEARLAELFTERMINGRNVVEIQDVNEVIGVMGQPEDYNVDGATGGGEKQKSTREEEANAYFKHNQRRIYRDAEDAMIAGVCSGLSHYLGWDPVILRVVFVLVGLGTFGTASLAYIICWALIPSADSTAEKLRMRGEPITVDNIRRFVNSEAKAAEQNINRWGKKYSGDGGKKMSRDFNDFFQVLGTVFGKVFGVLFILGGIGLSIALFSLLFFSEVNALSPAIDVALINQVFFSDDFTLWMLTVGVILCLGIPAIGLIYSGIRLLLNITSKNRGFNWISGLLFIVGVVMLCYSGVSFGKEWVKDAEQHADVDMTSVSDTLFIMVKDDTLFRSHSRHDNDFFDLIYVQNDSIIMGDQVYVSFENTREENYSMRVRRSSQGASLLQAIDKAQAFDVNYELVGDTLFIDPLITIPLKDKFRDQNVEFMIRVPEGNKVCFNSNIQLVTWYHDEPLCRTMTEDGWLDALSNEQLEEMEHRTKDKVKVDGEQVEIRVDDGKVVID